jgi:hypothetical protein
MRSLGKEFDELAFDQTVCREMPVEHPKVTNQTVRLAAKNNRKICERFDPPQHQAEFSVRVNEIRKRAEWFRKHGRQLDRGGFNFP